MEQAGTLVNEEALKVQSNNLGQRISGLEEQAYREAGKEFNLASTKDLRAIFFDEMELPVVKKTPGGRQGFFSRLGVPSHQRKLLLNLW